MPDRPTPSSIAAAAPSAWLAQACAQAACGWPGPPRYAFEIGARVAGSVSADDARWLAATLPGLQCDDAAQTLALTPLCADDADAVLARIAALYRDAGRLGPWRGELLAVLGDDGSLLGHVERAAVRPLGVRTRAVHLMAYAPDGRIWLQQRAFDKANDPGQWDTLVGGMVAGLEPLAEALARETLEEAGLDLAALEGLRRGRTLTFEHPVWEGWLHEDIAVYDAVLPQALAPRNLDGEVEQFACLPWDAVLEHIEAGRCTLEATLVMAESLARRGLLAPADAALVAARCRPGVDR
jgi:8-oxo-dGTP pyrophosphatase MutT (NUDIX family)